MYFNDYYKLLTEFKLPYLSLVKSEGLVKWDRVRDNGWVDTTDPNSGKDGLYKLLNFNERTDVYNGDLRLYYLERSSEDSTISRIIAFSNKKNPPLILNVNTNTYCNFETHDFYRPNSKFTYVHYFIERN